MTEPLPQDVEFLQHYGVKGMKWGVRSSRTTVETPRQKSFRKSASDVKVKSNPARRGAQDITVKAKPGRGVVSTKGGRKNVASNDAVEARAGRQKARASTTDALSNAELKKVVERMQLEKKYSDLEKGQPILKRGSEFVKKLFENGPGIRDLLLDEA